MAKPRVKMEDYIEKKMLEFCKSCKENKEDVHRITRTRRLAKVMATYIRVK